MIEVCGEKRKLGMTSTKEALWPLWISERPEETFDPVRDRVFFLETYLIHDKW